MGDYTHIADVIETFLLCNTTARVQRQNLTKKKMNVLARWGEPKLLINAHMDTVPCYGDWETPPTRLTQKDGKYYGLGTCDTKGNIFALLQAAKIVQPKNTALLFSFDEESGGITSGVTFFLQNPPFKRIKRAIILEPTNLLFANSHPGYFSFFIDAKSKGVHSSVAKGDNPIVKIAQVVPKLKSFNIAKIESGTAGNIFPNSCRLLVSIRNYKTEKENLNKLKNILGKGLTITPKTSLVPLKTESDKPVEVGFWSEAALFSQAGIKSYVFGAGDIRQAHTTNEFVEISQIEAAKDVFIKLFSGEIRLK